MERNYGLRFKILCKPLKRETFSSVFFFKWGFQALLQLTAYIRVQRTSGSDPWTKGFQVSVRCGSVQAARNLTDGMPLSPGMCWSLHAAHGSPISPET